MVFLNDKEINKENIIKILPIIFFPLGGIFSMRVNTSGLEIAPIFMILSVFLFNTKKFLISYLFIFFYSIILYFLNSDNLINYNIQRLIYSSALFAPYFCLAIGAKIRINAKYLYNLKSYIYIVSFLIALIAFLSKFSIFGLDSWMRFNLPRSPFDEPSRLGLFLVSISLAFFSQIIKNIDNQNVKNNKNLKNILISIFLISAAILTRTTHLSFTLFISYILIIFDFQIPYNLSQIKKIFLFRKIISTGLLFITLLYILPYLTDKLDFVYSQNPDLNLSELSWLNGLESALRSIRNSPFWGFGLGSLGNLSNYDASIYAQEILRIHGMYLNMLDGYSMAFRLIHDLGLVPFLILIFGILKNAFMRIKSIKNTLIKEEIGKFYFVIGFTLLLGSLIKEPTASQSVVALAPYFLMLKVI